MSADVREFRQAAQLPPAPRLVAPAPWACGTCAAVLGVCDGRALHVGIAVFLKPVTVHCLCCGAARTWRPAV